MEHGGQSFVVYSRGQYWGQYCLTSSLVTWTLYRYALSKFADDKIWRSALYTRRLCWHSAGPWQAGEMVREGPHEALQAWSEILTWGGITPYITEGWRQTVWKAALQRRTQGSRMNRSQQRASPTKQANGVLSCTRKNTTRRLRGVTLPLYSALVRHIWHAESRPGFPSTRQTWTYWNRPWRWLRARSIGHTREGFMSQDSAALGREGLGLRGRILTTPCLQIPARKQ